MPNPVETERGALTASLRAADPDGPTLCGEWTVRQLLGHLVLRERSLSEVLGRIPAARLQAIAQRHIDRYAAERGMPAMISAFEHGAPKYSPFAIPALSSAVNLLEYTVHHEDIRRAGDDAAPRQLPETQQAAVWSRLRVPARLTMRSLPFAVQLASPGHGSVRIGRGTARVTVTGEPVELALVAFGRQQVARVDYEGTPADVEKVRTGTFSL